MTWLNVTNDRLKSFFYPEYGMEEPVEVTENGKAQVPKDVAEQLADHPSGDFELNEDTDNEHDSE